MGNMIRQYWVPAMLSSELPSPDCPPVRVRILSENLIGFRATSGAVGLIANSCPHRGASLFFGRNEEEGLRCVYHGWKFDVDGNCVDMPSEPAESNFKSKVHATTYPCIERGGAIWAYMGPREVPPPLPDFEANMLPGARANRTMRECNYMQALEGDIDTCHLGFLHRGSFQPKDFSEGSMDYYVVKTRAPLSYSVVETDFGLSYAAYRPTDDGQVYWRIANFLWPCCSMNPVGVLGEEVRLNFWLPIDDEHVMVWGFGVTSMPSATQGNFFGKAWTQQGNPSSGNTTNTMSPTAGRNNQNQAGNGRQYLPDTSDWLGKSRPAQNASNDYWIDREAQSRNEIYSGIPGGAGPQDIAVQESMGPIWDRTMEHLGTSDSMVTQARRKMLNAARALRDHGTPPPSVDKPEAFATRTGGVILPEGVNWFEATQDLRRAFVKHEPEGAVPLPTA
jgi:phenylpropionate dioxygenase-like ring-hydroxylating dioxygenase large terminal subunit